MNVTTRRQTGETVIGLMVGTLLMSLAAAGLLALFCLNTRENSGVWNRADVVSSGKESLDRIGRLIRSARSLGDVYGVVPPDNNPEWNLTDVRGATTNIDGVNFSSTENLLNGTAFLISNTFPSAGDPYYGADQAPPGGWPVGWPAQSGQPDNHHYRLSGDTLVVQVPVFVRNTPDDLASPAVWPVTWNGGEAGGANGSLQAMDTYVFKVIPDPNPAHAGTFIMQQSCFQAAPPGAMNPMGGSYSANQLKRDTAGPYAPIPDGSTARTVLTGIVGPKDANGDLAIFNYIERVNNSATRNPPAADHWLTEYTGIVVELEVRKSDQGIRSSVATFKSEFYMRNNSQATLMGKPRPG